MRGNDNSSTARNADREIKKAEQATKKAEQEAQKAEAFAQKASKDARKAEQGVKMAQLLSAKIQEFELSISRTLKKENIAKLLADQEKAKTIQSLPDR
jgi:DNA-binding transcriptional regulator GbsR (MarR family)